MKNTHPETKNAFQSNLNHLAQSVKALTHQVTTVLSCLNIKMQNASKTPVTSHKTFTYIQKVLAEAELNPDALSSQITLHLLKEDSETLADLQNIEFSIEKLQDDLQSIIQIIRYDLYTKSKKIQDNLRKSESRI